MLPPRAAVGDADLAGHDEDPGADDGGRTDRLDMPPSLPGASARRQRSCPVGRAGRAGSHAAAATAANTVRAPTGGPTPRSTRPAACRGPQDAEERMVRSTGPVVDCQASLSPSQRHVGGADAVRAHGPRRDLAADLTRAGSSPVSPRPFPVSGDERGEGTAGPDGQDGASARPAPAARWRWEGRASPPARREPGATGDGLAIPGGTTRSTPVPSAAPPPRRRLAPSAPSSREQDPHGPAVPVGQLAGRRGASTACRRTRRRWRAVRPARRPAGTTRRPARGSRARPRSSPGSPPSRRAAAPAGGAPRRSSGGPAPSRRPPAPRRGSRRPPSPRRRRAPPPGRRPAARRRRSRRGRARPRGTRSAASGPRSSPAGTRPRGRGRGRRRRPRRRAPPRRRGSCATRCIGTGGRAAPARPQRCRRPRCPWRRGRTAGR